MMTERKRGDEVLGHESWSVMKKHKTQGPISNAPPAKEKKDKLAERVTALQELVSPFGKSDTASVLQEALGYIKFLHDQVQVLSTPYLKSMPVGRLQEPEYSLRSRGLCLVPISWTVNVANSNGADIWAPIIERRL